MTLPAAFQPPTAGVDVLLLEDSLADAEITLMALRETGLSKGAGLFRQAQAALDYLFYEGDYKDRERDQPRLILLDGHLPDMEGLEVLKRIRSREETARIPVVVVSSAMSEAELDQAYRLGANACMTKPGSMDPYCRQIRDTAAYWLNTRLVAIS